MISNFLRFVFRIPTHKRVWRAHEFLVHRRVQFELAKLLVTGVGV